MTYPDSHRADVLRHTFTAELVEKNGITSPEWREAFEAVPRHVFVPRFFLHAEGGGMKAVDAVDAEWLPKVYDDLTLVTQLDSDDTAWQRVRDNGPTPGRPTSSSTQPILMAWMLEALNISPGQRVLEIGTGTGYNAALLSYRLGDANVVSIDIDDAVIQRASDRLAEAGYHPHIYQHDGSLGFPEAAPFDRVIATCSFPQVPYSWIEQTRPGGLILTHLYTELDAGGLLLLSVQDDGTAHGRFLPEYGAFMPRRDYIPPDTLALLQQAVDDDDDDQKTPTRVSAAELTGDDFILFAALRMSGVAMHWFQPEGVPGMQTWLLGRDGSWAYQTVDDSGLVAVQGGARRLWNELERAHDAWRAAGSPARDKMGLSVAPESAIQRVWVDSPDSPDAWNLS